MELKYDTTQRGFGLWEFKDYLGNDCSLQKSSVVCGPRGECIWFGNDEDGLNVFMPNQRPSWVEVDLKKMYPDGYVLNNRMELSQDDVIELLPLLKHFAETGELPETLPENDKDKK